METRVEETLRRHEMGYNCAQAVACTYCDKVGTDEETMFKVTEALGFGMGCMEGTCGAVSAACVLAGMKKSTAHLDKPDSKKDSYKLSKQILQKFEEKNSSVICKELKGVGKETPLCSCQECIKDAARLAEEILFS